MSLTIDPTAFVSPDARITPSAKGTAISIGPHSKVEAFAVIRAVGGTGDVRIGAFCYINEHCVLYSGTGIELGDNVLLAPGVKIVPANHEFADPETPIRLQGFQPSKGGVMLEDDVWVGAGAVILDGVRLGRGCVVAAGSVVKDSFPANSILAGVPAKVVGRRGKP